MEILFLSNHIGILEGFNVWYSFWVTFDLFMIWYKSYSILKTLAIIIFQIYCPLLIFYAFRRINVWSSLYVTKMWFNFIKIIFNWFCFLFISITFILNIVTTKSITNFCWLMIIFFWIKLIISWIINNFFDFSYLFFSIYYSIMKNFFDFM